MNPVSNMACGCCVLIVPQEVSNPLCPSRVVDFQGIDKVDFCSSTSPEDHGLGARPIQNRLPFLREQTLVVVAEPVHVIEKNESRDFSGMCLEKGSEVVGVSVNTVHQSALEHFKIMLL